MKNLNRKQLEWSQKQVHKSVNKLRKRMFFITSALFLFVFTAMFVQGDITANELFDNGAPITMATLMGTVGDVDDVANSQRVGKQVKARLWLLSQDQWDQDQPFPSRSGITRGNIPLKSGEYWHYVDTVLDSPEPKSNAEEGEVASLITNQLTFICGGMTEAMVNLLEMGIGEQFFVVWEICSTGDKWLGGNGCKPMKLTNFEGGAGKDQTAWTITFKNQCGEIWSKYSGSTPTQAPETVSADATTITLTSNPRYQLTDGSVSAVNITDITSVTDSDVGRIVTILGSGGTYPSYIDAGDNFILYNGTQWNAAANSQISFKIWKDDSGSYKFIEVVGSRT